MCDILGNLRFKTISTYSDATFTGTPTVKEIEYTYTDDGKDGWNYLLTAYDENGNKIIDDNEKISYDEIGNPLTYRGATVSWYGRQMRQFVKNGITSTMTYDADGLRSSKTVGGVKTEYQYVGDKLYYENRGNGDSFYYFYDSYGNISAIYHHRNGIKTAYHVVTNSQGDVIALYSWSGTKVAEYKYDAWGNCTIVSDTSSTGIATLNPIRYRGYYYDKDLGLYYLQSRYYDAEIGRFINADGTLNGNGDITGFNMFAYCSNNPVMGYDPTGYFDWGVLADVGTTVFAGICAFGKGLKTAAKTLLKTGSVKKAVEAGCDTAIATFGAINNTVNAVYYNYISDGISDIDESNPIASDYVDGYIDRWERLDYTKQQTQETSYNVNAWRYQSEYSIHMYGWYATSWAKDKDIPIISEFADSFEKADVDLYEWDSRPYVKIGTAIWGVLGL